ncbi:MAG: hypothetical protein M1355_02000 [Patescibacteria group bacterium]|nr:hypothetical protein [Patescibacteria group bacterium]
MYEKVQENIKVLASFSGGSVIPQVLKWAGKTYRIKKVNLAYQEREGKSINYFYSVECSPSGIFKLKYNDIKLIWTLEELWVE